eukprot:g1575.t1
MKVEEAYEDTPLCHSMEAEMLLEKCIKKFPLLFGNMKDEDDHFRRKSRLNISCKEIQWKVMNIPLHNGGIQYNINQIQKSKIEALLNDLLDKRQIRRLLLTEPARMSPIMFKEKKDGRVRPLNDYRQLNRYCTSWTTTFPGTIATIRKVPSTWKIFTLIDLLDGFHQIGVDAELSCLFGFEALGKRWAWTCLPQGWSCSSGLFHSRIQSILEGLDVIVYIDDLLVGNDSKEKHDSQLMATLDRLEQWGLRVNATKMRVFQTEIQFLGATIENGVFSYQRYLEKMTEKLPIVSSKKALRSVLGMANYTRPACPHLSQILEPLHQLLVTKEWPSLEKVQQMVSNMWNQLIAYNLKVYRNKDYTKPSDWNLYCDWSGNGRGFALFDGPMAKGKLILINSMRMPLNYQTSSYLGELQTIVWSLKQASEILKGEAVTLWTDSESAQNRLINLPKPSDFVDKRISKCLGYLVENFPIGSRLHLRFLPGS